MRRALLIAAALALAACTHSQLTTAFDAVVVAASTGSAFCAAHPPGIPPAVAAQGQQYFADVLAAAPAISAELESSDSASVQALKIGEILAPYASRDIPGAPSNLAGLVKGAGAAIQTLLGLLGRVQVVTGARVCAVASDPRTCRDVTPEGVPIALTSADRKAIARSVARAKAALGR